jgi:SAM-dependent methyltransferase
VSAVAALGERGRGVTGARSAPVWAPPGIRLRSDGGCVLPLDVERWYAVPSEAEHEVLSLALPPVLDLGCGPARHTLALLARGIPAIGVDVSRAAVETATFRGAPALHRSVFDRLPDEGSWGTALLLDGNVGIGGEPAALLARVRALLRPGGRGLVEVEPPGAPTEPLRVRVEAGDRLGPWFRWARVGVDGLGALAATASLGVGQVWTAEGRWFARLDA